MRVFCINDIAFFYHNVCITTQRRSTTDISFFVTNVFSAIVYDLLLLYGGCGVATHPTFFLRIHTFFVDTFFTTPFSVNYAL